MAVATLPPILGYAGEPVPHEFIRQEGETHHLAVFLPGLGYTCDMPLFYYAELLLLDLGADLLRVDYGYHKREEVQRAGWDERHRRLLADAGAAWRGGLAHRPYSRVTLVGKSLGTLAMGHLLTTEAPAGVDLRAVWLTPLLRQPALVEQARRFAGPSFIAIGAADPEYDRALLAAISEAEGSSSLVIDRADHSLDVPGDLAASIAAVAAVLAELAGFLARPPEARRGTR